MSKGAMLTALGAVIAIVGLFLPWMEILGIPFNLWGLSAGKVVLVLGLLGAFFAVQGDKKGSKGMKIGALVMAVLVLGLTASNAPSREDLENLTGVYVLFSGAIVMLVGSIMLLAGKKK